MRTPLMFVDIKRVHPGDVDGLTAVWELETTALAFDLPSMPRPPLEETLNEQVMLRSEQRERWVACRDGRTLGRLKLSLPMLDNTHVLTVGLVVHPEARRQGIGRALFDVALRRAREESRTCLISQVGEPVERAIGEDGPPSPGTAFATALGARPVLAEMVRVLDATKVDEGRLAALEAEAKVHAGDYELVQWVGPAPEEIVGDLALLTSRLSTDAPMGELDWQEENWDSDRYREAEAEAAVTGRNWVTTAARHVKTGRTVAYTDIGFAKAEPTIAHQWTTIVAAGHRGHRLGMLIKTANFRLLRQERPATERIFTWNADSNEYMLSINKAMGFRPVGAYTEWQLNLSPIGNPLTPVSAAAAD